MTGRGDDLRFAERRKLGDIRGYWTEYRAAGDNVRSSRNFQAELPKNFIAPARSSHLDESGMSCIGVLAHAFAAKAIGNELRQI